MQIKLVKYANKKGQNNAVYLTIFIGLFFFVSFISFLRSFLLGCTLLYTPLQSWNHQPKRYMFPLLICYWYRNLCMEQALTSSPSLTESNPVSFIKQALRGSDIFIWGACFTLGVRVLPCVSGLSSSSDGSGLHPYFARSYRAAVARLLPTSPASVSDLLASTVHFASHKLGLQDLQ